MRILSEFTSDDGKRTATVLYSDEFTFVVEMYSEGKIVGSRNIENHTLQYAEDCAENWVIGVIK